MGVNLQSGTAEDLWVSLSLFQGAVVQIALVLSHGLNAKGNPEAHHFV